MHNLQNLPYRSKERDRDDASDPASFLFPHQNRVNHNADRPQSSAMPSSPPTDSAEATTRSPSPDGGVPIDEEALAMFSDYRHVVLSSDNDSSNDCPSDESSCDEGSYNDHPSRGTLIESTQVIEPLRRHKGHPRPQSSPPSGSDHQHNTNDIEQEAILSYASPLSVFNHQSGKLTVEPDSSMLVYQPFRGIQSAQPLATVTLNPRVGMAVEGGRLYLAQTLHHYYRKHIHCVNHGPIDGRPGHHRTVRKVHETGQVYRVWYCTSQPKWEGHRIDNTAYIELAKAQLDQVLFDRVLHELIRQLRSRDCQPVARNCSPQPDDFDHLALLSYVGRQGACYTQQDTS